MAGLVIRGSLPSSQALATAVFDAADVLEIFECYAHDGRYHFALGGGWSVALSADSAERIRVETCRLTQPVSTMWVLAQNRDRLAGLVRKMSTVPQAV